MNIEFAQLFDNEGNISSRITTRAVENGHNSYYAQCTWKLYSPRINIQFIYIIHRDKLKHQKVHFVMFPKNKIGITQKKNWNYEKRFLQNY